MKHLIFLLSLSSYAAIVGVNVATTHNIAVLTYQAASSASCNIEASKSATYTPLAYDVDGAYYAGAGVDSGGAANRAFIIGKMTVALALDGKNYSRALQTNTLYYYRITCGGDIATGTFTTKNIPLGMTWVPNTQTDGVTGNWLFPNISYTDRNQETIDPITGALMRRTLLPRDGLDEYPYGVLNAESCTGAAWTDPANCNSTGAYATYSGTSQAKLVAQVRNTARSNFVSLDFLTIGFVGFGTGSDRTISFCVSTDGTTCDGTTQDVVMPSSAGTVQYNGGGTVGDYGGWANPSISAIQLGTVRILIWKKATTGADTISLNNIIIYWGQSKIGLPTSGGFHDVCSAISSTGWTQCIINGQMYGIHVADGIVHTLGSLTFLNAAISGLVTTGGNNCETFGGGSTLWHATDSNTLFCNATLAGGGLTLVRFGTDPTNTSVGQNIYDNWFVYNSPVVILPAPYDLNTLLVQFDPTLPTGYRCGFDAVQGNYLIGTCRAGQQDTYAYTFAFSLGDGTAMGSPSCGVVSGGKCQNSGVGIVAAADNVAKAVCRWCTFHTLHSQGNTPVMSFEVQRATGTLNYGNNPQQMTLVGAINSTQTTINVTSSWVTGAQARPGTLTSDGVVISGSGTTFPVETTVGDTICAASQCLVVTEVLFNTGLVVATAPSPAWVGETWTNTWATAPTGYATGDPISAKFPHWIQTIAVGDYLAIGSEILQVTGKVSNTQLTVNRGCSYWEAPCSGTGSSASDGATVTATCNAFTVNGNALAYYWDYLADPTANNTNVGNPTNSGLHTFVGIGAPNGFSGSHQTSRGQARIMANYDLMAIPTGMSDRLGWASNSNYPLFENYPFAGQYSPNGGNTYQRHPSNQHMNTNTGYAYNWFSDVTPFVGGSGFVQPSTPSTAVEGTLYRLGTPDPNLNPNPSPTRKYLPTMMLCGYKALSDISGPNSHIVTSTTDYTYCYANAAGECRNSGDVGGAASAGQSFMNCPIINTPYCTGGENYIGDNDTCVGNLTFDGNGIVQFGFTVQSSPDVIGGGGVARARTLSKAYAVPRQLPGTANAKPTADGEWLLMPGADAAGQHVLLLKNPGMPPLDSNNRQTFIDVQVKIPTRLNSTNAYVEFGYDSNLYCTSRAETCIAAANNSPYFFASEAFTGISCASGCSVNIPAIPSRVLQYRVVWRDVGNNIIQKSNILTTVVP